MSLSLTSETEPRRVGPWAPPAWAPPAPLASASNFARSRGSGTSECLSVHVRGSAAKGLARAQGPADGERVRYLSVHCGWSWSALAVQLVLRCCGASPPGPPDGCAACVHAKMQQRETTGRTGSCCEVRSGAKLQRALRARRSLKRGRDREGGLLRGHGRHRESKPRASP